MCLTNDPELAKTLAQLRSHGGSLSLAQQSNPDSPFLMADFNILGYNYRLGDLQGAMGRAQLSKLGQMVAERRQLAAWYNDILAEVKWLEVPVCPVGYGHSYQAYVCRVKREMQSVSRDEIMGMLHHQGIGSRAGTHAVHELGYYRDKYGLKIEDYPIAAELYATTLALPLHNNMSECDVKRVAVALKSI